MRTDPHELILHNHVTKPPPVNTIT
jgi:hypothetical protein